MSKDKHTPGPWHYGGHTNIYAYYQRELLHSRVVACVPAAEVDGGKKERQANARLIAAAPDLLDALNRVMQEWNERKHLTLATRQAIDAAISKAEGRS